MKKFISRDEAAQFLGTTPQTISNWVKRGVLTAKTIKNRVFIDSDTLTKYEDSLEEIANCEKNIRRFLVEKEQLKKDLEKETNELKAELGLLRESRRETGLANELFKSLVDFVGFDSHPYREGIVVKLFAEGNPVRSIADEIGVGEERVMQIVTKCCRRIRMKKPTYSEMEKEVEKANAEVDLMQKKMEELKLLVAKGEKAEVVNDEENPELDVDLINADLSVRALNCLRSADIITLRQLTKTKRSDLLKLRNMGKKSICEISDFLMEKGLSFAD